MKLPGEKAQIVISLLSAAESIGEQSLTGSEIVESADPKGTLTLTAISQVLKQLETASLIKSRYRDNHVSHRPPTRHVSLTEKGRRMHKALLAVREILFDTEP